MSYARWSYSNWYAFDNVNGKFSLWHVSGPSLDLEYEDMKKANNFDLRWIHDLYPEASKEDVKEAHRIIQSALTDR